MLCVALRKHQHTKVKRQIFYHSCARWLFLWRIPLPPFVGYGKPACSFGFVVGGVGGAVVISFSGLRLRLDGRIVGYKFLKVVID